jgi:hypothetical protein
VAVALFCGSIMSLILAVGSFSFPFCAYLLQPDGSCSSDAIFSILGFSLNWAFWTALISSAFLFGIRFAPKMELKQERREPKIGPTKVNPRNAQQPRPLPIILKRYVLLFAILKEIFRTA